MGRRIRATPALRRRPRKRSGEEIVGAILDAAALILDRDGIEGLTTNVVARVAGVSVGSLYQYFPDKSAIVAEIARRIEAVSIMITSEEMVRLRDASAREMVSRVVSLSCAPAFGTRRLRRVVLREIPRGWTLEATRATDGTIGHVIAAFLAARAEQLRAIDLPRATFVVQHAVEGAIEAVLLAQPEALPEAPIQDEIFRLAWAYLAPDGDDLARPETEPIVGGPAVEEPSEALLERLIAEPSRRLQVPGRGVDRRAAGTRDALLDAAERVLTRDGFAQASARAIVAEAGGSIGGLYRHFGSVPAIFAALAARYEERAAVRLDDTLSRLEARDGERDVASAIVDAYLTELEAMPRALLTEIPRRWTEESVMAVQRATVERLAGGADRALPAFLVVHAVRSAIEAYRLLTPDGVTREHLRDELVAFTSRYLAASGSASATTKA